MKQTVPFLMRCAATVALVAGIGMASTTSVSAQALTCTQEPSASASQALSPDIQTPVIEVQELLELGQYSQALSKLQGIGNLNELKAYDQAVVNQLFAQVYIDQEQYEQGLRYLERVVRVGCGQLALEQINQMIFNVGQLYIAIGVEKTGATAQDFFKKGIDTLLAWFEQNPNARPDVYAMLSTAYLQIDPPDYRNGIVWIERAIEKAQELGEEPKEGWYRNLGGLYLEVGEPAKALPIMELLVKRYPKRDYWLQLAFIYGELGREREQFNTLQAAYHQDLLTQGQEKVYLAQLYIANGMPKLAANIMEQGMEDGTIERTADHYRFLADAMYTAKEPDEAIDWYKIAGEQAEDAQPFFFLGQIYMQKEEWADAVDAFNDAVRKNQQAPQSKKMRTIGTAHFNMGIAYFYLDRFDDASRAFNRARNYDNLRRGADQWIARIQQARQQ